MDPLKRAPARPVPRPRPRPAPPADPIATAKAALEADLARPLPAVPADKAGKQLWLENARAREAAQKKHLAVLRDAWFDGKLSFDAYTALSGKQFDFKTQLSRVARSLEEPKPAPPPAPGDDKCPGYLTPDLLNAMEKHPDNPLNIFGAIFLPLTMIVDGMTGLSRITGGCKAPAVPAEEAKPAEPR